MSERRTKHSVHPERLISNQHRWQDLRCSCLVVAGVKPSQRAAAEDLFADPQDPASFARQLTKVLTTPAVQEDLSARGSRRAREFSWRRTAGVILQGLRHASAARAAENCP